MKKIDQLVFEDRPYSEKELEVIRNKYIKKMKLSDEYILYTNTNFFYRCKKYGKKEELVRILGTNINVGNCSVLHRLKETPNEYKQYYITVLTYLTNYQMTGLKPTFLKYEHEFYKWLYKFN